jgi:tetratricopeptide (TPR) repeat protein
MTARTLQRCVFSKVTASVLASIVLTLTVGCNTDRTENTVGVEKVNQPELPLRSHDRMLKILAEIASSSSDDNDFVGDRHARQLRAYLDAAGYLVSLSRKRQWELHFELGRAELRLGNEERAIELLERSLELLPADEIALTKKTHFELGVASLRYGETQNCCLLHSHESCIVPIRGKGLHTQPKGAEGAIKHFGKVLELPSAKEGDDERLDIDEAARWLLNIAYMTLGKYPDDVPEQFLVDPSFFEPELDFPRFVNVYPKLGLDTFNMCGGAIVDDFDDDGDLDIVTCSWDVTGQTQVFRNGSDGSFKDVTADSGLVGFYGGLNLNHADYDNDGDLDVYIMRGAWLRGNGLHPNSLLRNDGDLKFIDVTFDVGLGEQFLPTKTSAWADYDNDGDLDLYVGNESSDGVLAPCNLFRNDDGRFVDVAVEAGVADTVFSMGAAWGDYNDDGWPDLYLSIVGENKLYRNDKNGTFTDVAHEAAVTEPSASFPTWFWDYDNDGHEDIFVGCTSGPVGVLDTEIRFEMMHLYRNRGDGTFADVTESVQLDYPATPMGANFGDLNNDGYCDFYLATGNTPYSEIRPNVMFLNDRGKRFQNVTMAGGFGHLQKGHGVSFADIDNDGDQDVYVQLGGAYPGDRYNDALFENPGFQNHFVALKLEGRRSNRCAIGARVRLDITEKSGEQRSIFHTVSSGSSFGANPFRQVIGIGTATKVDRLHISWPLPDVSQEFFNVVGDKSYRCIEGGQMDEIKLTSFQIGGKGHP